MSITKCVSQKRNSMTRIFYSILIVIFSSLIHSCSESSSGSEQSGSVNADKPKEIVTDPLLIEIHDMEKKAKSDTVFDRNTALRLLIAYQTYYNQHGKDSLGQAYLFEAAKMADALGKYQKAIDLLVNYHDLIGDYNKKAEAAFLVGFIYDSHLKDAKKAIEYYNKVIELYPKSQWAEQAKSALHLAGMSDEDLMKFLDEKNKKAS